MNKTQKIKYLLTGMASAGVVLTAVLTAKGMRKAVDKLENESKDITVKETVGLTWKFFIPAGTSGLFTILCIFGINTCDIKYRKSLAAGCGMIINLHNDYVNKVKELYGKEAHEKIMDEVVICRCTIPYIKSESICSEISLDFDDKKEPFHLFYDPISDTYFETTYSALLQAEYHLNRNFALGRCVSYADFLDFLGVDIDIKPYENFVWSIYDEIVWIDFDHIKKKLDTGETYYIIDTPWTPTINDCDYA